MLIFGWGLLAIRPRLVLGSGDQLRTRPLATLGLGIVALIGQFVLVVLLVACAILFGIFAGAIGGAFAGAALVVILSDHHPAHHLGGPGRDGHRQHDPVGRPIAVPCVPRRRRGRWRPSSRVAGLVPALGGLVILVIWILGLGAFTLYAIRTRSVPWMTGPPPAPPTVTEPPWPAPAAPAG